MRHEPRDSAADGDSQLRSIAAKLLDIAGRVAAEAEQATLLVRSVVDQTSRIASLAAMLEAAAGATEADVRQQSDALAAARARLDINAPLVEGLGRSIDGVAAISTTIAGIARESRILSLNARIEAARSDAGACAFAAVAAEMSVLTASLAGANDDIVGRTRAIARDMTAAGEIVAAHGALVVEQDELLGASLKGAESQRDAAAELAAITGETVGAVDAAAAAIGRVGANAVAVKLLARQLGRATG